jgi:hypothetical protein
MRRVAAIAVAFIIAVVGVTATPRPATASGFGQWHHNPATGHFYAQVNGVAWPEAEAQAVAVGGHLVTINDQAEESWLEATFTAPNLWIGFTDSAVEGTWVWSSGEPVTYTNWIPGQPDDWQAVGGEDYAVMNATWQVGLGWDDWDGKSINGIVEVPYRPKMPAAPAANRTSAGTIHANFSMAPLGTTAPWGSVTADVRGPANFADVPGYYNFDANSTGIAADDLVHARGVVRDVIFWYDPYQGGARVGFVEGVQCLYWQSRAPSCTDADWMFVDRVDPKVPDQQVSCWWDSGVRPVNPPGDDPCDTNAGLGAHQDWFDVVSGSLVVHLGKQ